MSMRQHVALAHAIAEPEPVIAMSRMPPSSTVRCSLSPMDIRGHPLLSVHDIYVAASKESLNHMKYGVTFNRSVLPGTSFYGHELILTTTVQNPVFACVRRISNIALNAAVQIGIGTGKTSHLSETMIGSVLVCVNYISRYASNP